mgnify:CR=1 FL=1
MWTYYKIPMTERALMVENVPLIKLLQEKYPILYKREMGRIELTYGGDKQESAVNKYNMQTAALYKCLGVPQYIIVEKDRGGELKEYSTATVLTTNVSSLLDGREISSEEVYEYLCESKKYDDEVQAFFSKEDKKEKIKKPLKTVFERFTGKKD